MEIFPDYAYIKSIYIDVSYVWYGEVWTIKVLTIMFSIYSSIELKQIKTL